MNLKLSYNQQGLLFVAPVFVMPVSFFQQQDTAKNHLQWQTVQFRK